MKVSELKTEMDAQFEHVKEQFRDVERRFEAVDRRFEAVDRRFEAVDRRFEAVDRRFDDVDRQIGELRTDMVRLIDERHDDAKRYMKMLADDSVARLSAALEGVPAVARRVDRLESGQQTSMAALDEHETRLRALEHRRR